MSDVPRVHQGLAPAARHALTGGGGQYRGAPAVSAAFRWAWAVCTAFEAGVRAGEVTGDVEGADASLLDVPRQGEREGGPRDAPFVVICPWSAARAAARARLVHLVTFGALYHFWCVWRLLAPSPGSAARPDTLHAAHRTFWSTGLPANVRAL